MSIYEDHNFSRTNRDHSRSPSPSDMETVVIGAQKTGLPAPVKEPYFDATPSGEVQVRVTSIPTRPSSGRYSLSDFRIPRVENSTRPSESDEERIGGAAFSRNRNESAYVESAEFKADNQRISHGRGDTTVELCPGSSKVTSGLDPRDVQETGRLQRGIFHDPISHLSPRRARSGEDRGFPWKVRTDTAAFVSSGGRTQEFAGDMSGSEDNLLGRCDNQGVRRRRSQMTDDDWMRNGRAYMPRHGNTRTTHTHHNNSNKKQADYSGESSWQDYHVHFEMVSEINGWDDTTKALELATSLRGSAQAVLSDLSPAQRRSYTHLVAALASRFQPTNQAELYRAQMKNQTRGKGQSLPELAQEIKRLTRLAYPTAPMEVREQLSRDCFTDCLGDPDLEWSIFQGKPKTIDDSVRVGLEYEAFTMGHRRKFPNRASLRRQTGMENDSDESDDMDNIIERLARMEKQETRSKPAIICFFCGLKGHFKRDCRKFLSSQGRQQGYTDRGNTKTYTQGTQTGVSGSGNF